jgi:hypothetical protein
VPSKHPNRQIVFDVHFIGVLPSEAQSMRLQQRRRRGGELTKAALQRASPYREWRRCTAQAARGTAGMVKFLAVTLARDQRGLALQIGPFDRHSPHVQFFCALSCSALLVRSCAFKLFRPSSLVAIAAAGLGPSAVCSEARTGRTAHSSLLLRCLPSGRSCCLRALRSSLGSPVRPLWSAVRGALLHCCRSAREQGESGLGERMQGKTRERGNHSVPCGRCLRQTACAVPVLLLLLLTDAVLTELSSQCHWDVFALATARSPSHLLHLSPFCSFLAPSTAPLPLRPPVCHQPQLSRPSAPRRFHEALTHSCTLHRCN